MKKRFLTLWCLSLMTLGFSQNKTSFGFRGGANWSNLSNTHLETDTGFYLGIFVHFKFSELYTLQPELGYSLQGGYSEIASEASVDIHYISLSVANKLFVNNTGLHFIIAPGFDFDADDSLVGLANRGEGNDVTFIDMTLGLGLGFEFNNGLGIEARYKQGLIDVFSGNFHDFQSEQLNRETQLNYAFQLGLFYKFKI